MKAVDDARWEQAQEWELAFWEREQTRRGWKRAAYTVLRPLLLAMNDRRATGDDWNLWWRDQFDGYSALPRDLGDYIELGCGPYTNTRLILEGRTARRVICSDPLVDRYITYRDRWLARAYSRGSVEVDGHPIEELPFERESFDTVVLVNVLDHVRDPFRCMERTADLVRPGGVLVFGQDLALPASAGSPDYAWFEEGHPIRPTEKDVAPLLEQFVPSLRRVVPPRDRRLQVGVLAFIGTKG